MEWSGAGGGGRLGAGGAGGAGGTAVAVAGGAAGPRSCLADLVRPAARGCAGVGAARGCGAALPCGNGSCAGSAPHGPAHGWRQPRAPSWETRTSVLRLPLH